MSRTSSTTTHPSQRPVSSATQPGKRATAPAPAAPTAPPTATASAATTQRRLARHIDIVERGRDIEVSFQAPCHSIDQLRFEANGSAITVEARWDEEADGGPVLFARKHTFVLEQPVDLQAINAEVTDGVVKLTIPKR